MRKTILIVEDQFLIAVHLQLMLKDAGWRVIGPAACVRDALHALNVELPMVALIDVHLGCELITPVAACLKASRVPFALASAYDRPEDMCGDVLAGVPNVGKPTDERRLMAMLERLTEHDRLLIALLPYSSGMRYRRGTERVRIQHRPPNGRTTPG